MPKTKTFRCDCCNVASEVPISDPDPEGWKTVIAVFCPECWGSLMGQMHSTLLTLFDELRLPISLSAQEKAAVVAALVTDLRCPRNEWGVPSIQGSEKSR